MSHSQTSSARPAAAQLPPVLLGERQNVRQRGDGARFGGANSRAAKPWTRRGSPVITVPGTGRDVIFDNSDAFVAAAAGQH